MANSKSTGKKKPATKKTSTKKPQTKKPAAKKTTVKKSNVAKKTAAKKVVTKKPVTKKTPQKKAIETESLRKKIKRSNDEAIIGIADLIKKQNEVKETTEELVEIKKQVQALIKKTNEENKVEEKKKISVLIKILIVSALVLIACILVYSGITFANWFLRDDQTTANSIKTSCFGLDMVEGDSINLTPSSNKPMYPMSEADAMDYVTPYTFTITNNCPTDMYFNVTLNTTGNSDLDNVLYYKLTDSSDNLINKAIIGTLPTYAPYNNSTYKQGTPDAYSIINSYILSSGFLGKATLDSNNQVVTAGGSKSYKLYIWMDENVTDLTTMNKTFNGKILITESTKHVAKVCKRATELHNDGTHTYGNLGTTGTLAAGDAFDCDVNGDGLYNAETERFYYVTDQDANTAALIYYNNVSAGVANNTTTYAYDAGGDAYTNGPVTAIAQLPTTAQWNNVKLTATIRDIKDESGTVKKASFNYGNTSARFITVQEVESICNITIGSHTVGELDGCLYLLENTYYQDATLEYGYWLENVYSSDSSAAWFANGFRRRVDDSYANEGTYYGVRPVIEVAKTDIEY